MARAMVDENKRVCDVQTAYHANHVDADLLFFSTIDDATKSWLKTLHHMWDLWKKCVGVSKTLTDYFETAPNPYLSTLRILVNTSDFNHIKTRSSLAFTVIEEFSNWIQDQREMYKECLVPDLKIATFKLVSKQKNMLLIRMVANAYNFMEHKELFLKMIEKMVEERKFKEAAQYATILQLQSYFADPEILLVPLILQSKLIIVEDFLTNYSDIQKSLVAYLDSLIAPGRNMQNVLDQFILNRNISDVKMSTIQMKPMTKLIARLVKLYNLPQESCPNLNQRRSEGALQFLIHKRYVDGSLSTESWREMIREAVGNDSKLQLEVVRMVVQANDAQESLYWAQEFDISKEQWPWAVLYAAEQSTYGVNQGASTSREENWDTKEDIQNYHVLKLSRDRIKVVNNPRLFEEFLDDGLRGVSVVGIDSEWKPSFGTKQTELALIQIATETNVYILDITTMSNNMSDLWTELALTLFENKNILKLGFGIAQDIAVIRNSLPALSKIKTHGEGYLDMFHLWKKLVEEYKFVFPHKGDQYFTNKSLSKLVELCLGHRLNKSEQFSNWERRPLRESQITYAALDAYCLLEIYNVCASQCAHMDIPFQDICAEVQHIPHIPPKKDVKRPLHKLNPQFHIVQPEKKNNIQYEQKYESSKKCFNFYKVYDGEYVKSDRSQTSYRQDNTNGKNFQLQGYHNNTIPAHKWRVVCDSMLGGLASKLRMCGCDCIHILSDRGGGRSVSAAMREHRVLLTRNKEYQKFHQCLSHKNWYRVKSDTTDKQLREVLNHFHVVVTEKDIFSRCQICNYDEFVKVPKRLMDELVKSFMKVPIKNGYHEEFNNMGDIDSESYYNTLSCDSNKERTWRLSTGSLNVTNCTTKYQMQIQIDKVPFNILKIVPLFYVCENCGKIYWDGPHLERTLNGVIKDLIVRE